MVPVPQGWQQPVSGIAAAVERERWMGGKKLAGGSVEKQGWGREENEKKALPHFFVKSLLAASPLHEVPWDGERSSLPGYKQV